VNISVGQKCGGERGGAIVRWPYATLIELHAKPEGQDMDMGKDMVVVVVLHCAKFWTTK